MTDVTPPPAPPSTPVWEDILDIFVSPTKVFERRKDDPQFLVAMVILTAIFAVFIAASWDLLQPAKQADAARGVALYLQNHPDLPADQVEAIRARGNAGGSIGRWLGSLMIPLGILSGGVILWLCAKIARLGTTIAQSFMVMTYAWTPKLVGLIASIVLAAVLPEEMLNTQFHLTLSPTQFMSPDATMSSTLLLFTRFDLTVVWGTFLLGLGLRITGNSSTGRAASGALLFWATVTALAYLGVYGVESLQGLR